MMKDSEVFRADNILLGNSLLYMYLANCFYEDFGIEGEYLTRKVLRKYASTRGNELRNRHKELGMKLNLENHLYFNNNPFDKASFSGTVYKVTPEEDIREIRYCPFVEEIIRRGKRHLAIMYCEETHPPLWKTYAPGTIVNLGKTLAQESSEKCLFDIFLRPGKLTHQQRKECFEEYDDEFTGDRRDEYVFPTPKQGYSKFSIIFLCSFYFEAIREWGDKAKKTMSRSLSAYLDDYIKSLKSFAENNGLAFDLNFISENYIFNINIEDDSCWLLYGNQEIRKFFNDHLYKIFLSKWKINFKNTGNV